ncbi:lysylphosphatidylglycerol synthase transmembrane domain-containing protein [Algirhabdus cladophorae]|uniref:lysylphosphatidylglycerol synthase transmembrane domain-containing protein n=1 Tax=Algirhabdus cladophorae TaxID=3377108 RepID=UPI003B8497A6
MTLSHIDMPQTHATKAPVKNTRTRDVLILLGLFVMMLGGLIGLAASTGWDETKEQLMKLSMGQVGLLLVLSLVNYGFRGMRWHVFATRLGLPTQYWQNQRHFIGGFAMSVTPGRVGELVRMRWLRRETGWSFERTAPLVLVDRASDLAAMAVILGVSISLSTAGIAGAVPVAILSLMAAFVVTRPSLLAGMTTRAYKMTGWLPRLMARIRKAAKSLQAFSNPTVMSLAFVLGFIGWIAEGYAFHLLLVWMGADIGFWTAAAIFTFSTLAGGLTGAPGGVGGAEAAMVALLGLQGVPLETSVPATLIIRVTTLWFAIGLGLLVFPVAETRSKKAEYALEN